jgi:predicted tellurium resistance membrane protein TerC
MLITESMHLSNAELFGEHIGAVPKSYLYFAISFSLIVEFINLRISKKDKDMGHSDSESKS